MNASRGTRGGVEVGKTQPPSRVRVHLRRCHVISDSLAIHKYVKKTIPALYWVRVDIYPKLCISCALTLSRFLALRMIFDIFVLGSSDEFTAEMTYP